MIEILNGIQETVNYRGDFKMRIFRNREYEDYPKHWHTDFEIIMPIENTYEIIADEKTCDLNVEDVIVIPPGTLHELYAPSSGQRIIMQIDYSMLCNLNELNSLFHMLHSCVVITPDSMGNIHKELSTIILGVTAEYFSTLRFREASIYSMLLELFIVLGRNLANDNDNFSNVNSKKKIEYIEMFANVCNYINEHCTKNIKIDDIADIAGFSNSHFSRLFKQVMNISWYDYLVNCRIMHAEKLLSDPNLSIMQVAMRSGFGSLATFNRLFKAKRQCTPTEYRSFYEKGI